MPHPRRKALGLIAALPLALAACGSRRADGSAPNPAALHPGETPEMRRLIRKWSAHHEIPESLLHRVVQRESGYNPAARNGPYWGLMQIHPQTARTMGYRGAPEGLLDAETNLEFAGKYLRGAWLVSRGNQDAAIGWYARGYYYEAKRLGLLRETGLVS
ncbi:transglycosylase SLT domain-containing protein [Pseudogemmobacter sonorensis]|uniref:transglycosylase SLT domain-containing protein n=1 Tax=Pseudogemmobacter sonorensis TaxID=2989681 RepID=UPI003691F0AA